MTMSCPNLGGKRSLGALINPYIVGNKTSQHLKEVNMAKAKTPQELIIEAIEKGTEECLEHLEANTAMLVELKETLSRIIESAESTRLMLAALFREDKPR
jgi:hypothetical protein